MKIAWLIAITTMLILGTAPGYAQQASSQDVYNKVRDNWMQNFNHMNTELLIDLALSWTTGDSTAVRLAETAHTNNHRDQILQVTHRPAVEIAKRDFKFVTNLRSSAQLMRTAFIFMNEHPAGATGNVGSSEEPFIPNANLNEFVIALGDFKDALKGNEGQEKAAKRLLRILSVINVRQVVDGFNPATSKDMRRFIEKRLADLLRVTDRPEGQKEWALDEKSFHVIRKGFRDFFFLLKLEVFFQPDAKVKKLLEDLEPLVKEMGKTRDELIQQTMNHKKRRAVVRLEVPDSVQPLAKSIHRMLLGKSAASLTEEPTQKCGFLLR